MLIIVIVLLIYHPNKSVNIRKYKVDYDELYE
jgi:hypothetical protein